MAASIGGIVALVGGVVTAGTQIYSATKGAPKLPTPVQSSTSPNIDAFRRKNASAMAPGAALAGNSSTLLGGSGPSQSVGTSTLLGQ